MKIITALQPIVSHNKATEQFNVMGVEFLARGQYEGKTILPSEISQLFGWDVIDLRVIDIVLNRATSIKAKGLNAFINVSPVTIKSESFSYWLECVERISEILPGQMVIEVNEMTPVGLIKKLTKSLSSMNVKLALDDYGEGLSGLLSLEAADWDYIKISESDYKNKVLLQNIKDAELERAEIIVERVEHASEIQSLLRSGVTHMQGYAFGKPVIRHEPSQTNKRSYNDENVFRPDVGTSTERLAN